MDSPSINDGTPVDEIIARRELERLAPSDADLAKAAEQMDAGLRLAWPMAFDGLGSDPQPGQTEHLSIEDAPVTVVPEVDDELIGQVAAAVAHFRADAAAKVKRLGKNAPRHIHREAQAVVDQCDEFLAVVGDYFRGES